ncbi:MAG: hypothetical protein Q7O66_10300 [Dehalococcoidia bacterium]|nr:hypothetical protein [Dehalococcoidia bacterium]
MILHNVRLMGETPPGKLFFDRRGAVFTTGVRGQPLDVVTERAHVKRDETIRCPA